MLKNVHVKFSTVFAIAFFFSPSPGIDSATIAHFEQYILLQRA